MAPNRIPGSDGRKAAVLLVDDHPIFRTGLAQQINSTADLVVCGEAETIAGGIRSVEERHPRLVIVDITLKDENGLELIKHIKARYPAVPVLVLSAHDESLYAERAIRAGAMGYITKEETPDAVMRAIRQVLSGQIYLSGEMMRHIVSRVAGREDPGHVSAVETLSDRELEVFELIGSGLSSHEIARKLHLSEKTVVAHRSNIRRKLKLDNARELVRQAIYWLQTHQAD